jgi:glycosyltransferase involved in cell wall biosynthesis
MKILMISPQPFYEPRGTPISVYERLRALVQMGHEVDLLTYHVGKDVNIPGVRILRTPRIPFITSVKIGPSWEKFLLDILMAIKSIAILFRKRYDVIHSHEEAAFFSMILGKVFHTCHLYDMHSSLPQQLINFGLGKWWPLIKIFELFEHWVLKTCNAVIVIDDELEEYVLRQAPGINQLKVDNLALHTGHNPPDPTFTLEMRREMRINGKLPVVYTGSFENYQGLGLLFESARIVCQREPRAFFLLVGGETDQIAHYQAKVRDYKLEDSVRFIGIVPPEDAIGYLAIAEVLVSPRVSGTSTPLKIYSYLHSGKPIVATKIGAHTQVLNNDIAFLVEPDKESFAQAIIDLLRNSQLRSALGSRAKQFAEERYNFIDYVGKVGQIYETLNSPETIPDHSTPLIED